MSLEAAAVREIREHGSEPKVLVVDGKERLVYPNHFVLHNKPSRMQPELELGGLTALVEYLGTNHDGARIEGKCAVYVEDGNDVSVIGPVRGDGDALVRDYYATATCKRTGTWNFIGGFHDYENFIIGLNVHFILTPKVEELLGLLAKITDENVMENTDSGLAQAVAMRSGLSAGTKDFPRLWDLQPRLTFPELQQPVATFLVRMRKGEGGKPKIALFMLDQDKWVVDAQAAIKAHIKAGAKDWTVYA